MPRKIVIHAGFHKTGTSTVQAVLRENRKLLMPALAIRLKSQMTDLLHATRGYSTYLTPDGLDKVSRRFDALLADLPGMPRRTLLLSAEELSGHLPGRGELADYSATPVLMYLFWQRAQQAFPKTPVVFCFGIRKAEDWLPSAWAEHVKSSNMQLDYDAYLARYRASANLAQIVQETKRRVPAPVHSYALEDCAGLLLGPADPVLDLCDIPPALRTGLAPQTPKNTRLNPAILADLLTINRTHTDSGSRKAAKARRIAQGTST